MTKTRWNATARQIPTPRASKAGRRSNATIRNTVRSTKLKLKPIQGKSVIASIKPNHPAKALLEAFQDSESAGFSAAKLKLQKTPARCQARAGKSRAPAQLQRHKGAWRRRRSRRFRKRPDKLQKLECFYFLSEEAPDVVDAVSCVEVS